MTICLEPDTGIGNSDFAMSKHGLALCKTRMQPVRATIQKHIVETETADEYD